MSHLWKIIVMHEYIKVQLQSSTGWQKMYPKTYVQYLAVPRNLMLLLQEMFYYRKW